MNAEKLKTNYLTNPIGIDHGIMIFSWIPVGSAKQTAYRIVIKNDKETVYDSGKAEGSVTQVRPNVYFPSRSRYEWNVTLWDENDLPGEPSSASFETSIAQDEWLAKWIDPEPVQPTYCKMAVDGLPLNKASYLRKTFQADTFSNARLYATAHGVYDVYINGHHIDGYFMAPGTSAYDYRIQVQTYDVSTLLKPGENEIIVTIGEGWWRGSHGWNMYRYSYGTDIALLLQLELDGKVALCSDETWEATQDGPLQENDTMRIERYDARKVPTAWHPVKVANHGFEKLVGSSLPLQTHERFPAKLITTPNGEKVLDFGCNIAGYVELDVTATGGEMIRLQHTDALSKEGNFQKENFQNPDTPLCDQVIEYICKPGRNLYHQTKSYYGFRYVLLETDIPVTGAEFTAVTVYSNMEQTGFFRCGNEDVNQLFQNILRSMKSNFVDIPTDCPHREKLGFTGDVQVFSDAALYLMDCTPVLNRWLRELAASQYQNGCLPNVAPRNNFRMTAEPVGLDGSAGWCNALEIVTTRLMERLNSNYLAEELYPNIKRWALYNLTLAKKSRPENESIPLPYREYILDCGKHWGEWNEPGRGPTDYFAESRACGHAEVATGFMAYCCLLVSKIAQQIGHLEDAAFFMEAYENTKAAYRFVYTKNGTIDSNRQCHFVRPVVHSLLDENACRAAVDTLAAMIKENGSHIGTGFLTTCELCNALTDYGHAETAYDLLLQTEQPSWLFAVQHGATSIWESWFGNRDGRPRGSQNHYSLGSVAGWLMSRVAGIQLANGEIAIKPYPDRRLGFVQATYHSPVGIIKSTWRYEGNMIQFEVQIPANTTASISLPDGSTHTLAYGMHEFSCDAN